jgi:hypothetical protein
MSVLLVSWWFRPMYVQRTPHMLACDTPHGYSQGLLG